MPSRSFSPILVVLLAIALTPARVINAQAPIKVSVNEVIVPVTVTDDKGRFVSNLTKSDFRILDENKEQKIDFFSHEQSQPIVIGFLIDTSNGMKIIAKSRISHKRRFETGVVGIMAVTFDGDCIGLADFARGYTLKL